MLLIWSPNFCPGGWYPLSVWYCKTGLSVTDIIPPQIDSHSCNLISQKLSTTAQIRLNGELRNYLRYCSMTYTFRSLLQLFHRWYSRLIDQSNDTSLYEHEHMMWSSSLFVSMIYTNSSMHYLIILIKNIILFIPWNRSTSLTEFLDHPYLHILNESDFIVSANLTNPSPQQISLDRILLARYTAYTLILIGTGCHGSNIKTYLMELLYSLIVKSHITLTIS